MKRFYAEQNYGFAGKNVLVFSDKQSRNNYVTSEPRANKIYYKDVVRTLSNRLPVEGGGPLSRKAKEYWGYRNDAEFQENIGEHAQGSIAIVDRCGMYDDELFERFTK